MSVCQSNMGGTMAGACSRSVVSEQVLRLRCAIGYDYRRVLVAIAQVVQLLRDRQIDVIIRRLRRD